MPLIRNAAPNPSVTTPSQSAHDHVARRSFVLVVVHHMKRTENASTIGTTISSPFTTGANADAASAPTAQLRERVSRAFAITNIANAAYGYASVSSTIQDEYESEGMTAAPVAAKSAGVRPTTRRA